MSAPGTQARTRLQAAADAESALAAAAALAANAPPVAAPAGANGTAAEQALILLVARMERQELLVKAQLAQSSADAAARAAADEANRAQARAGAAPLFSGKHRHIETHRWLIALERWFAAAHIDATDEETRLEIAASSLRDAAQAWWAAKTADGTAAGLNTWMLFGAAMRKQFMPLNVEVWALREREALIAAASKSRNGNVLDYTAKFEELDQLLPNESALSRVVTYGRGLPEAYAVKCNERSFATLAEATSAMTALWHAKESARHPTASLSNADAEEPPRGATTSSSVSAASPSADPIGDLRAQVAQLTAMMTERFQSSGRGRGERAGGRSRQREGESRARSRTPGLSDEIVRARLKAGLCIKCGQAGHFKTDCTNEVKLN
jgi:hypothetical protein